MRDRSETAESLTAECSWQAPTEGASENAAGAATQRDRRHAVDAALMETYLDALQKGITLSA